MNNIKLSDFQFWKYDFKIANKNERTGEITPRITELNWFTPIGFTKNNSLIVIDIKGKKQWVKEEFYNSSSSDFWKKNDNYGILVRNKTQEINPTKLISAVFSINANKQEINN